MLFHVMCAQPVLVGMCHCTLGSTTGIVFIPIPWLWEHNEVPALSSLLQQRRNPWAQGEGVLSPGIWCSKGPCGTEDGDGHSGMGDLLQAHLGAEPGDPHRWEEVPQVVQ